MIMRCGFDDFAVYSDDRRAALVILGTYPPDPGSLAAGPLVEPVVADLYHRVSNSRRREHRFCKRFSYLTKKIVSHSSNRARVRYVYYINIGGHITQRHLAPN